MSRAEEPVRRGEDGVAVTVSGSVLLSGGRLLGSTQLVDVLVRDGRVVSIAAAAAGRPGGSGGSDGSGGPGVSDGADEPERVELGGRTVMRGLRDAHVHFAQWALARQRLDVSGARSAADTVALVVARLRDRPLAPGAPLIGFGFRDGLWPDAPSAAMLDDGLRAAGLPDTPVVLVSGDLHCGWLNVTALARHGVVGHPTGIMREQEWFALSEAISAVPTPVLDAWVDEAARAAAARGVVSVIDYELADNLVAWRRRIDAGADALRVAAGTWPEHLDQAGLREFATGDVVPGSDGLLTQGPLKVISDGSLNTRTAFCHQVYPGLEGTTAPHGVLAVGPEELTRLMATATRFGLTCAIHAIGDRAVGLALDAFEATGARGSIEHAQLLAPADLVRFAALGVVASIQPEHALDDRDVADRHWPGQTGRAFAYADLLAAGAELVLGSDAPVAPLDPWLAIAAAVHRSRDDREAWHPEQELPLDVALAASTGGRAGVEVGDVADLAIVDVDPFDADDATLRAMPVSGTLLAGRWTWCTLTR
ncbi:amidohydrolase [Pengzhenrongella frigida]|uniref:Amidohydrolase n=1 Tax=Pengzhenrongella frigida TaxID=1259133 RepID=A0A4Q5N0K2_9MICO|nr:amidohydrolase family protein [Cellulomonas sp. HLT2-17]RYV51560.1 amidohydrolase [Cellulomonas sp. HLT2-17]